MRACARGRARAHVARVAIREQPLAQHVADPVHARIEIPRQANVCFFDIAAKLAHGATRKRDVLCVLLEPSTRMALPLRRCLPRLGVLAYNKPMRKYRFPRAAYVRQLERLYADLSEHRDVALTAARYSDQHDRGARLLHRSEELGDVQQLLAKAVYLLDNLRRLS